MTGHTTSAQVHSTSVALLANMLASAQAMASDGVAHADDIDLAMRLGVRHPVGPFELIGSLDATTRGALGLADPEGEGEGEAVSPARVPEPTDSWTDPKVGVVGTGFMASGIACAAAVAGQEVWVLGRRSSSTARAMQMISTLLKQAAQRDRLGGQTTNEVLQRIRTTTDVRELVDCDLIVESVAEDLAIKRSVFAELDAHLPHAELLASTTSSLRVSEIAAATRRPARVGGLHFFSPVAAMKLVEVAQTADVPDALVARAAAWTRSLGKVPVRCVDRPGFIVNSLLVPFLNDVVRAHELGLGSPAELDELFVTEAGHPMGPFRLLDLIGLDVLLATLNGIHLADPDNDRLRPAGPLVQCVARGHLGRKTGRGFYDYSAA